MGGLGSFYDIKIHDYVTVYTHPLREYVHEQKTRNWQVSVSSGESENNQDGYTRIGHPGRRKT